MAQCLGHRQGTGCTHRSRSTQGRDNWQLWQLCYSCARKLHPQHYKGKKNHGVKTFPDVDRIPAPFAVEKMPDIEEKIRRRRIKVKIPVEIKKLRNIEKNS